MRAVCIGAGFALASCLALTACGGGGNSLPQPSATTAPPSNPDYFPVNNTAAFEVAMPLGSLGFTMWNARLGVRSTYGISCDSASGLSGDYFANAELLVPDVEETSPQVIGPPMFVYVNILVTKDLANDLIVDGYVEPATGPGKVLCVTPYVFMKSHARAGQTWSYTDFTGRGVTAAVVFDHQPRTYNAGGAVQSYSSVTEVNYGTDFTIDWALGYGPVQIVEHNTGASEPLSYTAFGYTLGN